VFLCVFYSELIIENTACPSEANDLYTEVEEHEETYLTKENENPLYETAGRDAVLNPIYARFVCYEILIFEFVSKISHRVSSKLKGTLTSTFSWRCSLRCREDLTFETVNEPP